MRIELLGKDKKPLKTMLAFNGFLYYPTIKQFFYVKLERVSYLTNGTIHLILELRSLQYVYF
jgi:hypothetical protein